MSRYHIKGPAIQHPGENPNEEALNNDPDPHEVGPWMAEKELEFPVLLDGGYASDNGVQAYPTTWFIDPQGRRVFVKTGWSDKLLEEFAWRIEELRTKP